MRVLLTSARTLGCLEIARQFRRSGHEVFVAETFGEHLCGRSRTVRASFVVPPVRTDTEGYLRALIDIARRERIDLIVPTCEEILAIAAERERFDGVCDVLAGDFETLLDLHDKWRFVERMRSLGLPVPRTQLLTSVEDLRSRLEAGDGPRLVLKPAYSRFAARTVVRPRGADAVGRVRPSTDEPWLAQEFVAGRELASFGVAHGGRLSMHVTYPIVVTAPGGGPTVVYEPVEHPAAFEYASRMVAALGFTGQFGLDFVETEDGRVVALECNPRTTGGVHCFDGTPGFLEALLFGAPTPLSPRDRRPRMVTGAMLFWVLPAIRSFRELGVWMRAFARSRGVVHRFDDSGPTGRQLAMTRYFERRSREVGADLREATTWDLEFDAAAARRALAHRASRAAGARRAPGSDGGTPPR